MQASEETRIVQRCYDAWADKDLEALLGNCAEDAVYHLHVPPDVLRFAGRHVGKPAVRACLEAVLADYEFLAFGVDWIGGTGQIVKARVVYYYQHPVTGDQFEAGFRHVWVVKSGLVTRCDEYHDVTRLKAFLDMVRGSRGGG